MSIPDLKEKLPGFAAPVEGLKPFQQATVSHVIAQLAANGSGKFLVADEVGLGKTKVARGVIRNFLNVCENSPGHPPLTVLYLCANQQLAWQNLRSFHFIEAGNENIQSNIRLSLLPWRRLDEGAQRRKKLHIYALTPGTSFEISSGAGTMEERAIITALLDPEKNDPDFQSIMKKFSPPDTRSWEPVRDGACGDERCSKLRRLISREKAGALVNYYSSKSPEDMTGLDLLSRVRRCFGIYDQADSSTRRQWRKEKDYPGAPLSFMRSLLAQAGIGTVDPDLIIMDEFQRYDRLLFETQGDTEEGLFAQLVAACEKQSSSPAFLLLSATPYATFAGEEENEDNAHLGFLKVLDWLANGKGPDFAALRNGYFNALAAGNEEETRSAKQAFEQAVMKYMCRTERKNLKKEESSGNKFNEDFPHSLWHTDGAVPAAVQELLCYQRVYEQTRNINCCQWHQLLELAKYASKPLSFMKYYKLQEDILKNKASFKELFWRDEEAMRSCADSRILQLQQITGELFEKKLLWIPPCAPRRKLDGDFAGAEEKGLSKVLIFSAWRFVPRMISLVLSSQYALPPCLQEQTPPENAADAGTDLAEGQSSWHPAKALYEAILKYFPGKKNEQEIEALVNTFTAEFGPRLFRRASGRGHFAFTREMLQYCKDGCLEDVFEEYLYMVCSQLGSRAELWELGGYLTTLNLRLPSTLEMEFSEEKKHVSKYAADCFGEKDRDSGDSSTMQNLQRAFNTPFAPFVLSTTSIGQEGLDFHWYCRKIIHWNIPRTPIELEQRNGRIDRYHNLSVRQSIAAAIERTDSSDWDWRKTFEKAGQIWHDACGLMPDWYIREPRFPIGQFAFYLPLSCDEDELKKLCFQSGCYRSILGQPNFQEFLRTCVHKELLMKYPLSFQAE